METTQIISLIGALGIGSVIGVFAKSYFDQRAGDKKMLFEARVKAYSGITGRLFNLFLEPDITALKHNELIWAKLNQLLSEALLMASHNLSELLGEYKVTVHKFHIALDKKDESESAELHKKLVELTGKIHVQMRKDLHIDSKSVFEEIK
ncbi:hypothetical protein KKD95_01135 [Patescibacteria group bacterium]|nr:hypothetical protein [Patescibacteria group bacterium]